MTDESERTPAPVVVSSNTDSTVINGYRDDIASRAVCPVTGQRTDPATAIHISEPDGMPTGWVLTPEGAGIFAENPGRWITSFEDGWRLV